MELDKCPCDLHVNMIDEDFDQPSYSGNFPLDPLSKKLFWTLYLSKFI